MVNLISLAVLRQYAPISNVTDDALIAAAINHAQVELLPSLFGLDYYNQLVQSVVDGDPLPVLAPLQPVLACFAASKVAVLTANMIFPTKIQSYDQGRDAVELKSYYMNLTSSYLNLLYKWCDANNVKYNQFRSTSFSPVVISGSYGRYRR